ncbi:MULTISPECIES: TRAP transporter small permease [Chelativorans]|jgi:TRAP-type C4-dicarboxylate transport system permease small subunit|uniref:TRAP transporter small permease protein n=1 Tax=Chelativorans sp. (strain BNC1) TaxID=266779 RepID=Q11FC4_CHESB|nr:MULTISPECIES: TRAP transporter small permease [Chelativorans]
MSGFDTFFHRTCQVLAYVLSALTVLSLAAMFVGIVVQVVARTLFSTSVLWLDDLLMSCFTVSIFCGIALAFRARAHLAISTIADSLPVGASRLLNRLIDIGCIFAMAGIGWFGIEFTQSGFGQFTPVLRLPLGWVYIIIPVSAALSILFILENQLTSTKAPT